MKKSLDTWLNQLHASVNQPPLRPRAPLHWGNDLIGSVDAVAFVPFVAQAGLSDTVRCWMDGSSALGSWHLLGLPNVALGRLAAAMRQFDYARVTHFWRDEQLTVHSRDGAPLATVERGAVRALGVTTQGVHLHGCTANGRIWIQQRAFDKKTDPGCWDTLMGGMVSALDSLQGALARETLEEAGLRLDQLQHLKHVGRFTMCAPNTIDGGLGYVIEQIDWFECLVPDKFIPVNCDGEVHQFKLVSAEDLRGMLFQNAFTTEAAIILGEWLSHCGSKH